MASLVACRWFQSATERAAAKELAPRTATAAPPGAEGGGAAEVAEGKAKAKGKRAAKDEGAEREHKPKRDKYAGMPRKKRRALERAEMFAADADTEGGGVRLPNQKAAARGAKAAAKRSPVPLVGKRALASPIAC